MRRVAERDQEARGFKPIFARWPVARVFAALRRWHGLLVDRAGIIEVATGHLAGVAARASLEAHVDPRPAAVMTP